MAEVMMALGTFRFALDTAAYQSVKRTTAYRWPQQERIGRRPVSQALGPGLETIVLSGIIYPFFRGGIGQLDAMRQLAGTMQPLRMMDGFGNASGKWCITQIEEDQSLFAHAGVPQKMTFNMTLQQYGEER